jgi:hypothetical protein
MYGADSIKGNAKSLMIYTGWCNCLLPVTQLTCDLVFTTLGGFLLSSCTFR